MVSEMTGSSSSWLILEACLVTHSHDSGTESTTTGALPYYSIVVRSSIERRDMILYPVIVYFKLNLTGSLRNE
jgi:hypothetical protein